MAKKIISLLLALTILLSMAACGNSSANSTTPSAQETPTIDPATINTGKYEEPVTLTTYFRLATVFLNLFSEEELKTCYYTTTQEQETNIHVEYEWIAPDTADDADQKTSMAIATGDIPDFMIVNRAQLALLVKTDLINKNLEPLFNAYANEKLKAYTFGEGDDAWESLRYNGGIVAIPNLAGATAESEVIWIRQDWLENLNMEIPTNMDELFDVMMAFKNNDPDGNGQDDTVGMTISKDFMAAAAGMADGIGLFNAFSAYPKQWVPDGNGGLIYGSVAEGAKDTLAWMNKCYEAGLIEKDFASMDANKAIEASVSGRSGVQLGAMWNHMWPLQSTVDNNSDAKWIAIPVLGAHEGDTAYAQCGLGVENLFVISSKCEHPEAVIKLLNFFVDAFASPKEERDKYLLPDESGVMTFPRHYIMAKAGNPLVNLEAHWHVCEALESKDTSKLTGEELGYYNDIVDYLNGDLSKSGSYRTFGPDNSSYSVIDNYYKNDLFMRNAFTTADTATMQQKQSAVDDKILEFYTQVIMGVKTLDDWDSFMTEVGNLGLTKITEEVNEWYAAK